jgi:hypothetical protein
MWILKSKASKHISDEDHGLPCTLGHGAEDGAEKTAESVHNKPTDNEALREPTRKEPTPEEPMPEKTDFNALNSNELQQRGEDGPSEQAIAHAGDGGGVRDEVGGATVKDRDACEQNYPSLYNYIALTYSHTAIDPVLPSQPAPTNSNNTAAGEDSNASLGANLTETEPEPVPTPPVKEKPKKKRKTKANTEAEETNTRESNAEVVARKQKKEKVAKKTAAASSKNKASGDGAEGPSGEVGQGGQSGASGGRKGTHLRVTPLRGS